MNLTKSGINSYGFDGTKLLQYATHFEIITLWRQSTKDKNGGHCCFIHIEALKGAGNDSEQKPQIYKKTSNKKMRVPLKFLHVIPLLVFARLFVIDPVAKFKCGSCGERVSVPAPRKFTFREARCESPMFPMRLPQLSGVMRYASQQGAQ